MELHFDEIPSKELETILHQRCAIPLSYCKKMVAVMLDLQVVDAPVIRVLPPLPLCKQPSHLGIVMCILDYLPHPGVKQLCLLILLLTCWAPYTGQKKCFRLLS